MTGLTASTPLALHTPRLLLRPWLPEDRAPFAALNADPEVMAHFPALLSRAESDALTDRLQARIAEHGWGFWALTLRSSGAFIGFTGLNHAPAALPFAPAVEIGWRLARAHWGQGLASEAAQAAARFAFDRLALPEIVAFTPLSNQRSRAVMERLGMRCDGQFEHFALPAGHALRAHWLYRLARADAGSRILGA